MKSSLVPAVAALCLVGLAIAIVLFWTGRSAVENAPPRPDPLAAAAAAAAPAEKASESAAGAPARAPAAAAASPSAPESPPASTGSGDAEAEEPADDAPAGGGDAPASEGAGGGAPGSIRGVARFEGTPPVMRPLGAESTAGCKHHAEPAMQEHALVKDGKLQNVFVSLARPPKDVAIPPAPKEPVVLDQLGCVYRPHVSAMRAGQTLLIRNSDDATHNVNIRASKNDASNPTQTAGSADVKWTPAKGEIGVPFECNLHPWMKAWVCVEDHPWFDVTGADGAFEIQGLPPGEYRLIAWHERYEQQSARVTVPAGGGAATVEFTFEP